MAQNRETTERVLLEDEGITLGARRYQPGGRQGAHRDSASRITIALSGGFEEETSRARATLQGGDILFKPRDVAHADAFGPAGVHVLSLSFEGADAEAAFASAAPSWRPRRCGRLFALSFTLIEAARAGDRASFGRAAADLLSGGGEAGSTEAPPWLARLKDELETVALVEIDCAARAQEAGCRPAHASRLFRRAYGTSMTEHAHAHAVRRASALLATETSLADAAIAAGFYDQSHMNRVFRRITGRTPGACRRLLAAC